MNDEEINEARIKYNILKENGENSSSNILKAFTNIACQTKESNEILIYMGQVKVHDMGPNKIVDSNGDFAVYQDLETEQFYRVLPSEMEEFENKHNVIHIEKGKPNFMMDPYIDEFRKIRKYFFKQLIMKPQEEVVFEMFENRGYTYKKIK